MNNEERKDKKAQNLSRHAPSVPLFFQMTWFQRIKYWLLALLFVGLIALYVNEFLFLENTFEVKRLVMWSMWIGGMIGSIVGYLLYKDDGDFVDKLKVSLLTVVPFILFGPLFGSLFNRVLCPQPFEIRDFEVFKVEARVSESFGILETNEKSPPNVYFVYIKKDGEIERIKYPDPVAAYIEEGSTIYLPVKRGRFCFEFVGL